MPITTATLARRITASCLALLLVLSGCDHRDVPPPGPHETRITFDFTPHDDRFAPPAASIPGESSGSGSGDGGWGNCSCNIGSTHGCSGGGSGGGKAALILVGVIVVVVVIVVLVDWSRRNARSLRSTDYHLRLTEGSRQTILQVHAGTNRLNLERGLVQGLIAGSVTADIVATGGQNAVASFAPRMDGDRLVGW